MTESVVDSEQSLVEISTESFETEKHGSTKGGGVLGIFVAVEVIAKVSNPGGREICSGD
ncbi:hypothetical protein RTP6_006973 [Batrachochytrium dendrobatidis]